MTMTSTRVAHVQALPPEIEKLFRMRSPDSPRSPLRVLKSVCFQNGPAPSDGTPSSHTHIVLRCIEASQGRLIALPNSVKHRFIIRTLAHFQNILWVSSPDQSGYSEPALEPSFDPEEMRQIFASEERLGVVNRGTAAILNCTITVVVL